MSKILLINPPFNVHDANRGVEITFPLGLGYLASTLLRAGYNDLEVLDTVAEGKGIFEKYKETKFFSFGLSRDAIRKRILKSNPLLVGITCSFTKRFENVIDVAAIVKEINPEIKVVVGGAHPSAMPEEVIRRKDVDYVIIGEGEESFLAVVEYALRQKGTLAAVDGLAYKDEDGIHMNKKKHYIEALDSIPFPFRKIFPMDVYLAAGRNSIITSRGCPHNCSFCSIHCVWGRQWRARSPLNVVEEIELLVKEYNIEFISFDDDNMSFDKKRFQGICQGIIDRGLHILWNTPNGISIATLDKDLLCKMKESGCYALNLAIESGDPIILHKIMRKAITLEMVRNVVKWCKELGILTLGYFVIGIPGETKGSMMRSFDFAKELLLDVVNVFIATPYPGSQLYQECLKNKYLKSSELVNYTAFDAIIETPLLKSSEVQEFLHFFVGEYKKFHDSKSKVATDTLKEAIRRPTRVALSDIARGYRINSS